MASCETVEVAESCDAVEVSMSLSDSVMARVASIAVGIAVEVGTSVERDVSVDAELALQGLALELDTKQLAIKARTNVLGIILQTEK